MFSNFMGRCYLRSDKSWFLLYHSLIVCLFNSQTGDMRLNITIILKTGHQILKPLYVNFISGSFYFQ